MAEKHNDRVAACVGRLLCERLPRLEMAVPGDARIREIGLDSVAVMDLVMAIEDEFDMVFPLDRLAEVETVDDLTSVVGSLIEERTAP